MKITIATQCPYCGMNNTRRVEVGYLGTHHEVVTCDTEEGGCDRYYAVAVSLEVKTKVFTMVPVAQSHHHTTIYDSGK